MDQSFTVAVAHNLELCQVDLQQIMRSSVGTNMAESYANEEHMEKLVEYFDKWNIFQILRSQISATASDQLSPRRSDRNFSTCSSTTTNDFVHKFCLPISVVGLSEICADLADLALNEPSKFSELFHETVLVIVQTLGLLPIAEKDVPPLRKRLLVVPVFMNVPIGQHRILRAGRYSNSLKKVENGEVSCLQFVSGVVVELSNCREFTELAQDCFNSKISRSQ